MYQKVRSKCRHDTGNYDTSRKNMRENPLLYALVSLQVVHC